MRGQEVGPEPGKGSLIGGIALTFGTLAVLTLVIVLVLYIEFGSSFIGPIGWFIVLALLLAPLAIWHEKRTHGKFWADSVTLSGADWDKYAVDHDYRPSAVQKLLMYLELPLLGPRLIVGGWQRQKMVDAAMVEPFLRRCAMLVYTLADYGEATQITNLVKPGDTPDTIDRVLAHLDKRGWTGHSSDNKRIWLSSRAKDELANWGLLAST